MFIFFLAIYFTLCALIHFIKSRILRRAPLMHTKYIYIPVKEVRRYQTQSGIWQFLSHKLSSCRPSSLHKQALQKVCLKHPFSFDSSMAILDCQTFFLLLFNSFLFILLLQFSFPILLLLLSPFFCSFLFFLLFL